MRAFLLTTLLSLAALASYVTLTGDKHKQGSHLQPSFLTLVHKSFAELYPRAVLEQPNSIVFNYTIRVADDQPAFQVQVYFQKDPLTGVWKTGKVKRFASSGAFA